MPRFFMLQHCYCSGHDRLSLKSWTGCEVATKSDIIYSFLLQATRQEPKRVKTAKKKKNSVWPLDWRKVSFVALYVVDWMHVIHTCSSVLNPLGALSQHSNQTPAAVNECLLQITHAVCSARLKLHNMFTEAFGGGVIDLCTNFSNIWVTQIDF